MACSRCTSTWMMIPLSGSRCVEKSPALAAPLDGGPGDRIASVRASRWNMRLLTREVDLLSEALSSSAVSNGLSIVIVPAAEETPLTTWYEFPPRVMRSPSLIPAAVKVSTTSCVDPFAAAPFNAPEDPALVIVCTFCDMKQSYPNLRPSCPVNPVMVEPRSSAAANADCFIKFVLAAGSTMRYRLLSSARPSFNAWFPEKNSPQLIARDGERRGACRPRGG